MDTVLITGGEIPEYKYVKHLMNADYICVADSGFDWAIDNGVDFDIVVGDMDSIQNNSELDLLTKDKVIRLPKDKDDTDTVFALKYLKKKNASKIVLIGGGGGRLDHLLGIISLFKTDLAPDVWITNREIIYCFSGHFSLNEYKGYNLSVYPLDKVVCSINSNGLKWDLSSVDWTYRSVGISNHVELDDAWIDSGDNKIFVIIPIIGKGFE